MHCAGFADFIVTDCNGGWHISFSVVSASAGGLHFPLSHACSCETRSGCTESMFTRPERRVLEWTTTNNFWSFTMCNYCNVQSNGSCHMACVGKWPRCLCYGAMNMCFGPVAIQEGDEVGEGTVWDGLCLGVWDVWKNKWNQKITAGLVAVLAL